MKALISALALATLIGRRRFHVDRECGAA